MAWEYGGYADKYDMTGEIKIGTGTVKVHDIFDKLPDFMKDADIVFSDPPYNKSAFGAYYTKAGIPKRGQFDEFVARFMVCLTEINPRIICIECGVAQTGMWQAALDIIGYTVQNVRESYFYGDKSRQCKIICAVKDGAEMPSALSSLPCIDEEKAIEYICRNVDFECIADLCMGKGLVAFYANRAGKKFVGTELNPNRLAVCCERVTTNDRGKIN